MSRKFDLTLDERDDGTKVWSAECLKCGRIIVGERNQPVTVISVDDHIPESQFSKLKEALSAAWDQAVASGRPIIHGKGVTFKTHDHGSMQRAIESHVGVCGAEPPAAA